MDTHRVARITLAPHRGTHGCAGNNSFAAGVRRRLGVATVAVLTLIGSAAAVSAGEPGGAGALFLRIGLGARAAGMGEAFIAVAEDASSVYWNPAAMAPVLGTNVMMMHNEYFQSVRLEQAAITHETDYGTFGLAFAGLYMDDMERRGNVPTATPLDPSFSAYDLSFTVAYSRYVLPNVSVGLAVKPVFEKIDESDAIGVAVDAGVYHVSRVEGVKLAAVAGNVGPAMKFEEEEFDLPRYFKVGASYEREFKRFRSGILVTLDGMFPNDGDPREHAGFEYRYERLLFLRAGYKAGYDSQGATFGAGVSHRQFNVDYAVMLMDNDLDDSHRVSLSIGL